MQTAYSSERIIRLRKERGMTQAELARAAGLSRITIAKYETGKIGMSVRSAQKLSSALGCAVGDIIPVITM